jgi:hypothetical protein
MTLKISGIRGKIGSSKGHVFKALTFIRSLGKEHLHGSLGIGEGQGSDAFNLQAHISGRKRMGEVVAEKAFLAKVSRHDSWNTGGPN